MSGPHCRDCRWMYRRLPADDHGDCTDPSKRIYDSGGSPSSDAPTVFNNSSCSNWAAKPDDEPST